MANSKNRSPLYHPLLQSATTPSLCSLLLLLLSLFFFFLFLFLFCILLLSFYYCDIGFPFLSVIPVFSLFGLAIDLLSGWFLTSGHQHESIVQLAASDLPWRAVESASLLFTNHDSMRPIRRLSSTSSSSSSSSSTGIFRNNLTSDACI